MYVLEVLSKLILQSFHEFEVIELFNCDFIAKCDAQFCVVYKLMHDENE